MIKKDEKDAHMVQLRRTMVRRNYLASAQLVKSRPTFCDASDSAKMTFKNTSTSAPLHPLATPLIQDYAYRDNLISGLNRSKGAFDRFVSKFN